MSIQPYLMFQGRCEEALEFYRQALGAEVVCKMLFQDAPKDGKCGECPGDPPPGDKVMHAAFKVGDTEVLCSDGMCNQKPTFEGFSLTLNVTDTGKAKTYFEALSKDGHVDMPLAETFFAKTFGCVRDRFGVSWMVIVPAPVPVH